MKIINPLSKLPRWGRRLVTILTILGHVYGLTGYFLLPILIRAKLPGILAQALHREVTLGKVKVHPFDLSVTLDDLRVKDHDGAPFLGWDRLHVNLQLSSALGRTLAFKEIVLAGAYGRVVVDRDGRLNFADLTGNPEPAAPAGPPRAIAIRHLSIQRAQVVLLDRSTLEPFATTVGPVSLDLDGFRTDPEHQNPYAFSGSTEAGETFSWNGFFETEPLRSRGTFTLEHLYLPKYHPYYGDQVAFRLRDGRASLKASYDFQWSSGTHVLKVSDGAFALLGLKLAAPGAGEPAVDLPRISAQGIQADLLARSAEVASVLLEDGRLAVTREPGGELSLVRLLTPKPSPKPKEPPKPFTFVLKELGLRGFRVAFEDLEPVRPVPVRVEHLDVTLKGLTLDPAGSAALTAALTLNGKATLSAEGTVRPFQAAADLNLKVKDLDLPVFDPYLAPATDIRLTRGTLSLEGRLRSGKDQAFKGNLRLDRFEAVDGRDREAFLRHDSLRLTGLEVSTRPRAMKLALVQWLGSEQRLVVAKDGSTNVVRALKLEPAPGAVTGAAIPATQGEAFQMSLAKVQLKGGRLTFIDRSLEPNGAFVITDLEGTSTSLSSAPDTQSTLTLKGLAGGLAPLLIQGRATPLRQDQDTDVLLRITGSDLQDFSPYAGKYLGYGIHKGKLDVDAHIVIRERKLDTLVKTRMDQFYLGEKTGSPDATHLPVKLALAILRDRKGVIDLELPVQGSLDDPDFKYGRIVWGAVVNVLTKIVTSPFSLLAKLAGGGADQDLSFAAFEPGSAVPGPEALAKAQSLAKALAERPDLSLEAEGTVDPNADVSALKKQALEAQLEKTAVAPGPDRRARALRRAFETAFPPAPPVKGQAPAPQPPPGEMEQRLLGTLPVTASDLAQLADARAKALLKLLEAAQIPAGRLFEVQGGPRAKQEGGSRVYFGLK